MSAYTLIRYVVDGDVGRLTLASPPLNIMTLAMMQEINRALEAAVATPALRALVIAGEGKAFSAGVAIEDHVGDRVKPMLDAFHRIFHQLRALDCPTIAAVQGATLGGGAELATFCDLVVAAEDAKLGQPEIRVGVFPPIAALHYPLRIGAARALDLILTGRVLGAAEAERIGLVDRVVPPDRLGEAVEAQLAVLRTLSVPVLRLTKRAVREGLGQPFAGALARVEQLYHGELMTTADAAEGLQAFLDKRKPVWKNR